MCWCKVVVVGSGVNVCDNMPACPVLKYLEEVTTLLPRNVLAYCTISVHVETATQTGGAVIILTVPETSINVPYLIYQLPL